MISRQFEQALHNAEINTHTNSGVLKVDTLKETDVLLTCHKLLDSKSAVTICYKGVKILNLKVVRIDTSKGLIHDVHFDFNEFKIDEKPKGKLLVIFTWILGIASGITILGMLFSIFHTVNKALL